MLIFYRHLKLVMAMAIVREQIVGTLALRTWSFPQR
jgi:hypothetical protein